MWRYWSGVSSPSASFTSWESAPELEAEPSIPQSGRHEHSGGEAAKARSRATRKLMKEFGSSSSVRRVAEDHLLTGKIFDDTSFY